MSPLRSEVIIASIRISVSSDNLKPSGPNSLMPLSSNELCDAEIMTPISARRLRVSMAIAGVGSGPTRVTSMPAAMKPAVNAGSIR